MMAYVLMNAISTFYALSGKFAINEFSKILVAFGIYLWIVFRNDGTTINIRKTIAIFASVTAIISFLSIDAASIRFFYNIFCSIFKRFAIDFSALGAFEQGIRISSIAGNPNVFASIVALGTLFSIYLVNSSINKKERISNCILLGINALGFILAFSMGATVIFFLSIVVYIAFSNKETRTANLLLMVETAVITLVMSGVSFIGLGQTGRMIGLLPVFAAILNGCLIYLVHNYAGIKMSSKLAQGGRKILFSGIAISIVFVVYIATALNVTSPYRFSEGETLRRGDYPSAGQYQLNIESSNNVNVIIESQNSNQVMMHTSTMLYSGNAAGASFDVPEGSKVVYFNFTTENGIELKKATYFKSDGKDNSQIKLKYTFLPGFIANRLQGLKANQNAIQRMVFFEDGLKIFKKSPIYGAGLGSFEDAIKSVQGFYYETKYAHNHYIQMLVDCGIMGLLLYLFLLLSSAYVLFKGRKNKTYNDVLPALFAALVMIAGHSMVEVIMSASVYLPFAFAVFALIVVCYGKSAPKLESNNGALTGLRVYGVVFSCVFILLLTGNFIAQSMMVGLNAQNIFPNMETAAILDIYDRNDYLATYVVNSVHSKDKDVLRKADKFAEELSTEKSNVIQKLLTDYYFQKNNPGKAFEMAKSAALYTGSDVKTWTSLFDCFEKYFDPTGGNDIGIVNRVVEKGDYYVDHILEIYDLLLQHNKTSMEKIQLSTKNNIFLTKLLQIKESHAKPVEKLNILSLNLFSGKYAIDLDENGIPDVMKGNISSSNGLLKLNGNMDIAVTPKLFGSYKMIIECNRPSAIFVNVEFSEITKNIKGDTMEVTFDLNKNGNGSDNIINVSGSDVTISNIQIIYNE
ncbi:MAG: O-antigen ligase family protein [Clostridiales bacterium]|nr:O-antigen ligase family protein [Clostridiales bacterium]